MTCTPLNLPGGGVAIVCTKGGKPKRCATCQRDSKLLCDGCDAQLCRACAFSAWANIDFCPRCSTPVKLRWLETLAVDTQAQRTQLLAEFTAWARRHLDAFPRSEASRNERGE